MVLSFDVATRLLPTQQNWTLTVRILGNFIQQAPESIFLFASSRESGFKRTLLHDRDVLLGGDHLFKRQYFPLVKEN